MSGETRSALVTGRSTLFERTAGAVVGLGFLAFVACWVVIFQWAPFSGEVLGVPGHDWLGLGMLVLGVGVAGLGLASRADLAETSPSEAAGLIPGIAFGLIGLVTGTFVGAETFGLGQFGGIAAGLVLGAVTAGLAVLPREDVGSTLVPGAFLVFVGGVVLGDVITVGWQFDPEWLSATFTAPVVVPLLTAVGGLLAVWSAGKARGGFGTRGRENGAVLLVSTNAFAMLAVLGLLVAFVVRRGLPTLLRGATPAKLQFPFLTNVSKGIYVDIPGVLPAIVGTVWLVVGAVLFAVPLGVGAAVFLTEYADEGRFTSLVEIATNGLWSTPSIVFGLFGLAFLVPRFGDQTSLLAGQLVLGFMLLPLVVITSREAILAVPDAHRDASAALGVTKWETVRSVVLPSAAPGVVTGVILGVGRIAGETAPILLVIRGSQFPQSTPDVLGGFAFSPRPPFVTNEALLDSASALPLQLFATITAGSSPKPEVFTQEQFGWGTALVLLVVVLGLYTIGIVSRIYFRRKLEA